MRPAAASRIILPVGVGLMSRGPHRRGRVHDHHRHGVFGHQRQHRLLGQVFRHLVDADDPVRVHRRGLVGDTAVAHQAKRGHAAAIDHALHPRATGRPAAGRACPPHWRASSPAGPAPTAGSRPPHAQGCGSPRPRAPGWRGRSGRLPPVRPPARRRCDGRRRAGPAGAAGGRAPAARAPPPSPRSRSPPVTSVGASAMHTHSPFGASLQAKPRLDKPRPLLQLHRWP